MLFQLNNFLSIYVSVLCYIFRLVSGAKTCAVEYWRPGVVGRSVPERPGTLFSCILHLGTDLNGHDVCVYKTPLCPSHSDRHFNIFLLYLAHPHTIPGKSFHWKLSEHIFWPVALCLWNAAEKMTLMCPILLKTLSELSGIYQFPVVWLI